MERGIVLCLNWAGRNTASQSESLDAETCLAPTNLVEAQEVQECFWGTVSAKHVFSTRPPGLVHELPYWDPMSPRVAIPWAPAHLLILPSLAAGTAWVGRRVSGIWISGAIVPLDLAPYLLNPFQEYERRRHQAWTTSLELILANGQI